MQSIPVIQTIMGVVKLSIYNEHDIKEYCHASSHDK